ncbi:hypothetical protein MHK13_09025 [Corynebacterium hadale]|uniref:hypothetical protein n=1 Tax=Corynebacterium hadale TaxID=2026255 RepID=UPI001EF259B5|nr:hypothetical protein [Corynebacterium hadale]MCG7254868.1 hypothetical protein [Corynebacterium hadale]MCG7256364.1 hypothetical protein [Corynebacterium hadale]MCG7266219.1 hypothetical protein [Corynebacterium hadale]
MSAMTHLDRRFLWHQFKAGPWMRFLGAASLPLFVLFAMDGAQWMILFGSFMCVMTLSWIAIPEPSAFKALGMNRARVRQQVLTLVVPFAAVVFAVFSLINPHRAVISSAIGVVLAAVTFLVSARPSGEPVDLTRTGGISLARRRGGFAFEVFWRPMCVWAVPVGVITGILYALCARSASSWVTAVLPSGALLFYWAWAVGSGLPSVATAQSFGITRKSWVVTSVSVVAVASVLVTGSTLLVAMLIDASVPVLPLLLHGVIGSSVILLAKAVETWMPSLVFFIVIFAWTSTRQIMDVAGNQAGVGTDAMQVVLVFCGLCLLSAAVVFALMLTGRLDPKRPREVKK